MMFLSNKEEFWLDSITFLILTRVLKVWGRRIQQSDGCAIEKRAFEIKKESKYGGTSFSIILLEDMW